MNPVRAAAAHLLALGGVEVTHHTTASRAGGVIHHIESGAGDPLVLLHGGGGGGANWFRVMASLAQRFRVLAPDLPGFGESAGITGRPPLGTHGAEFLGTWLESVTPTPSIVVGTSFGALAAFRLAQAQPARVRSVALIDPVGFGRAVALPVRLATIRPLGRLLLPPSRAGGRLVFDRLLTGGRVPIPPQLRLALLEYLWQCDVAGAAVQLLRNLPHFGGVRGQREVITPDELRAFRTPCLIVWGGRDRFVPAVQGRRAAAHMPSARLHVIPDAGHSPNWETPDEVLSALGAFLDVDLRRT